MNNLETERLILREVKVEDADDFVEGLNDLEVTKWLMDHPHPYTKEDAIKEINETIEKCKDGKNFVWVIVVKAENKVIGRIGLTNIKGDVSGSGGMWIARDYWDQGYGTEALQARTRFGFETLNLRRMESIFFEGNTPSRKLIEKIGYQIEGMKREGMICKADDKIKDVWLAGLLKKDWNSKI